MRTIEKVKRFTLQEVEAMTKRLVNLLLRVFRQHGDQGAAMGVFSVVGRGDGSLNDSYRQAEPGDDFQSYHIPLNARQPRHGPFYVHTRANNYVRQGVLIPDITGNHQPGSNRAIYEREDLTALTTELLLRVAFQLGHQPGLILPKSKHEVQVVRPETTQAVVLKQLHQAQSVASGEGLTTCLDKLWSLQSSLEFAIIISGFKSDTWQAKLERLSGKLEVVAVQIVDPWDLELSDTGRIVISQDNQLTTINTSDPVIRKRYRQCAQREQAEMTAFMRRIRAGYYQLTTDEPLIDQLTRIFRSPQIGRRLANG